MTSVSSTYPVNPAIIFTFNSPVHLSEVMSIAEHIDHTQLNPAATEDDIRRLCQEALEFHFKAVCVSGSRLKLARELLSGSGIQLAAVVGFPHGNACTAAKCCEAAAYVKSGADELDIVLNIGWIRSGNEGKVGEELKRLRNTAPQVVLKLILETCYLEENEKIRACQLACEAGWDFVKTSTGFGPVGATLADVKLMKDTVGHAMQIKASGGIRDYATALTYLEAGASRIGTSSGPAIVRDEKKKIL
jgi:deoxyribose-phosphate aldolase